MTNVVADFDSFHCIYRQGFVFTSVYGPANILDAIVVRNPKQCDCWSPKKSFSERTLEEHIEIINRYKLERAVIIAEDIEFITQCPTLKYLQIIPSDTAYSFDYSPLYKMPELRYLSCRTSYGGCTEHIVTTIDYAKIHGLEELYLEGSGHQNYGQIKSLERLVISNDKINTDLQNINSNLNLKKLWIIQNKIKSLKGINQLQNLQELSLDYNRVLHDISEITSIASSLRALYIENCPKIMDFSCLNQLPNLEHLELHGKNTLVNLGFLEKMPKLKTFSFSMKIQDGDLTPCLHVPYVHSTKNRKEYNLRDKDLPKGKYVRADGNIE